MPIRKLCLLLFLFIFAVQVIAAEDFYAFNSSTERQRFENLTGELRCLVCQNQNLAESNAALAVDLRNEIFQQIQTGRTDSQIVKYLVNRYGNFILYRPPFQPQTLGLWLTPFLILLGGLIYLLRYIRHSSKEGI